MSLDSGWQYSAMDCALTSARTATQCFLLNSLHTECSTMRAASTEVMSCVIMAADASCAPAPASTASSARPGRPSARRVSSRSCSVYRCRRAVSARACSCTRIIAGARRRAALASGATARTSNVVPSNSTSELVVRGVLRYAAESALTALASHACDLQASESPSVKIAYTHKSALALALETSPGVHVTTPRSCV